MKVCGQVAVDRADRVAGAGLNVLAVALSSAGGMRVPAGGAGQISRPLPGSSLTIGRSGPVPLPRDYKSVITAPWSE